MGVPAERIEMKFIELFQRELVSLGFALLSAFMLWLFRSRPRLQWGMTHGYAFNIRPAPPPPLPVQPPAQDGQQLPQPVPAPQTAPQPFLIHAVTLVLANRGRSAATNVEVTFNWRPDNFEIWPARPFDHVTNPDGRFTLRFANLAPREQFQIEILTPYNMPNVLNVRCPECVGQQIPLQPMRVFPRWFVAISWSLLFLGLAAVVYIVMSIGSIVLK
jgi:hypothetical protein